ncbi:hypothetical protein [Capnocytophaga stomatis]|uniref:hypothetical protein n=1 Tax=Capnocytophaga stomatis TaxID=1848904 RepID=UPI0019511AC9|nr:hypothetical protein [Capnocytophaga stomatis]
MALAIVSTGAYAQGTPVADCNDNQNKPLIGATYTYEVNISGGTAPNNYDGRGNYQWYVTKDANLLNISSILPENNNFFSLKGGSPYNATAGTSKSLQLAWKPDALTDANPFFLVMKYTETKNGCNTTNIKAMEIKPLNKFKLNIESVRDNTGAAFVGNPQVCSADIASATIEGGKVKYIYGTNTLYYKITMTGFSGEWKPTITLPNLAGKDNTVGRKYTSVKWNGGVGGTFENFGTLSNDGNTQTIASTDKTNKTEFILEVTIDNGTYEGLADETVEVATKGNMILADGSLGRRDVGDNCVELTDVNNKKTNQKILARPTITAGAGEFIQKID